MEVSIITVCYNSEKLLKEQSKVFCIKHIKIMNILLLMEHLLTKPWI